MGECCPALGIRDTAICTYRSWLSVLLDGHDDLKEIWLLRFAGMPFSFLGRKE